MAPCECLVPKKCCCCYSLKTGSLAVAVIMFLLMLIVTLAMIVQVFILQDFGNYENHSKRQLFAFTAMTCCFTLFMTLVHAWLFWGVRKARPTAVLSWVVINGVWILQTLLFVLVSIGMHVGDQNTTAWLVYIILIIIALCIFIYGYLVVYGHWLELKRAANAPAANS